MKIIFFIYILYINAKAAKITHFKVILTLNLTYMTYKVNNIYFQGFFCYKVSDEKGPRTTKNMTDITLKLHTQAEKMSIKAKKKRNGPPP